MSQRPRASREVFNPFNIALPNNPTTVPGNQMSRWPARPFGRVVTMRDPRIMQFARKYVF